MVVPTAQVQLPTSLGEGSSILRCSVVGTPSQLHAVTPLGPLFVEALLDAVAVAVPVVAVAVLLLVPVFSCHSYTT